MNRTFLLLSSFFSLRSSSRNGNSRLPGLVPALQKLLVSGSVKAEWTRSDTGREVRSYKLTARGLKQLDTEQVEYQRMAEAIAAILGSA